jgi:hypothetical protein
MDAPVSARSHGRRRRRAATGAVARSDRLGGTEGNEVLTVTAAVLLTALLIAEGVTVVRMRGLVSAHMFIGFALIPPVLLKLGSTGYRFARYYTGARAYRTKGPPRTLLRVLAPVLVVATTAVFVTGVLLLAAGHKAGALLELHKVSFIAWVVVFGVHFLAYSPQVVRTLPTAWRTTRRPPGAGLRGALIAASAGGGVALALALLPTINGWRS